MKHKNEWKWIILNIINTLVFLFLNFLHQPFYYFSLKNKRVFFVFNFKFSSFFVDFVLIAKFIKMSPTPITDETEVEDTTVVESVKKSKKSKKNKPVAVEEEEVQQTEESFVEQTEEEEKPKKVIKKSHFI